MWRGLALLLCVGLTSCWGYSISPCDDNNKGQIEESGDAELTCTGITHDDMVWRLGTGNAVSQIGECSWPSGTCNVTDSDYSLSRPQRPRSVLTVTDNHRTKIAGTVMCAGLNSEGTMVGTVRCDVRVVYTSYQVTNCAVKVDTFSSTWTVSGSCDVNKIYASDDQYSCQWFETPQFGSGKRSFTGRMDLGSSFPEEGRPYYKATCHLSLQPMLTADGVYSYSLEIDPSNGLHSAHTVTMQSPAGPPVLFNCSDSVIEGDDDSCTCQASAAEPSALVTWSGSGATAVSDEATLFLNDVPKSLDGHNYTCSQYWGGHSTGHVNTTVYTLHVNYPPPSPPQISGSTTGMEGHSLVLSCTVTGGNPPVDYVTFYCSDTHGDNMDSASTENGQTVVTSTIEINSLTARDNGSQCTCFANWNPRPTLYQATSTVTILVLGADSKDTTEPLGMSASSSGMSTSSSGTSTSSTLSPSSSSSNGDSAKMDADDDDSVPYIAGGVAAAVIVIIIVVVVVAVVLKRRKHKPRKEESRTNDEGDDEEFQEHVNIMYESSDDVSPHSTKPSAVAFRIPAAENSSPPRRDAGAPGSDATDPDQNYSTIPSQFFQSPTENGNVTTHAPRSSAEKPENIPHSDHDNELDPYSSIDGDYDGSAPNPDTDLYSSADPAPENPVVVVPAQAPPPEDAGAYAVVNKRDSKKQLAPQNNDYAVVNKSRASSRSNAGPDSAEDPDSPPEQYIYAEVNKEPKGSNPESAARPPEQEAAPYAQVQKPKPVPATKPKPAVAPKPSVTAKPKQGGGASSNENPGQGRPRVTSDYEEVDLPNDEATPVTEDDYNTLAFHRRPSADIREDPEAEYSHITAI